MLSGRLCDTKECGSWMTSTMSVIHRRRAWVLCYRSSNYNRVYIVPMSGVCYVACSLRQQPETGPELYSLGDVPPTEG
jgi:hypothetical protein